jgi:TRAP-type C4-dicarboxylate transport system substrate-binding protein
MRHVATTVLAAAMLAATLAPASARTIKFGTLAPQGSAWYEILRDMAESWREASGGSIEFRIYPGGIVGDEHDMVRKMRVGQLQAAMITGQGLSGIAPEIQALQLPMMLRSYEELDYVMARVTPRIEATLESKGFKVLAWGDAGWVRLFATRPFTGPDDRKGLRLFSWSGDSAFIDAWKCAGFQPIPLPATELHSALQSGLVNAFATTPLAALSFQWFGQAKHMTDLKWVPLVGATVISTHTWDKIPDEVKPRLLAAARETGRRMKAETRPFDAAAIAAMQEHGLEVHPATPEMVARWERDARACYSWIVGPVVPPETAAEVERLRDEYRARQAGR